MLYPRDSHEGSRRKCSKLGTVSINFVPLESEQSILEEPLRLGPRYG